MNCQRPFDVESMEFHISYPLFVPRIRKGNIPERIHIPDGVCFRTLEQTMDNGFIQ